MIKMQKIMAAVVMLGACSLIAPISSMAANKHKAPDAKSHPVAETMSASTVSPTTMPPLVAKAWLLIDVTSGQTIASVNAQQRIEPASLTKLMTAYLAFEALKAGTIQLQQKVSVSQTAWKASGSRMFLEPNMPVSVDDLLHGMIVQSGNDASIALAETIAGNDAQFVQRMNAKAQQLGLRATQFRNPTGLPDPEHFTTANDLAQLVTHLINDYPEQYGFYKIKEFSYNNVKQPNRNRLLWSDPSVDGVKTGHTDAAGYCLIASAKRGNRRLLSIVLGTPSDQARAQESQKLLNYGFSQFETVTAHAQSRVVETVKIWQGQQAQIPVGFTQDRYITIPTGMSPKLTRQFVPDAKQQPLVAPITAGTPVGTLKLMLNQQVVAELPVVALESVAEANWLARMWDRLRMKWAS